jgi:hypothetical protein
MLCMCLDVLLYLDKVLLVLLLPHRSVLRPCLEPLELIVS